MDLRILPTKMRPTGATMLQPCEAGMDLDAKISGKFVGFAGSLVQLEVVVVLRVFAFVGEGPVRTIRELI